MPRQFFYTLIGVCALAGPLTWAVYSGATEPEAAELALPEEFVALVQDRGDVSSWWALSRDGQLWRYNPDLNPRFYFVGSYGTGATNPEPAPYIRFELAEPVPR